MKTVSVLLKPASGRCNLRCKYCFYEDVSELRQEPDLGFMSEATAEQLISQAAAHAQERISFAFQGGEPMLRGLPFFETFVALERRYLPSHLLVEHSIQTNGTLVNDEWARFFRDNHFLVGLSLDGTKDLHDGNRIDHFGKGTWNTVTRSLKLLQTWEVPVNLLCVITGAAARRGQAVYQNLKKLGARYLQFIPCLDPLEEERGNRPFSLSPERYGHFLCTVFDLWYQDWERGDYTSIRLFDDYVHLLAGQPAGTCATAGTCGRYFVVEGDGSVYPCDFFVLDSWRMGKLGMQTFAELADSERALRFCTEGRGTPRQCANCQWLPLCNGGCRRDWIGMDRNYHCTALRTFFAYAYPRLRQMAQLERRML